MNCGAIKQKLAAIGAEAITETEYARKGFALDVQVAPHQLVAAVLVLDAEGFFIEAVTGVDWLGEQAALRKDAEAKAAAEAKAKAKLRPPQLREKNRPQPQCQPNRASFLRMFWRRCTTSIITNRFAG